MYSDFSVVYDRLMGDVDYKDRTRYICSLFEKFDRIPELLLDLACGTGEFSNCFAEKGVQVIGVDISPEMLSLAKEKSAEKGFDVMYLCQNACNLDLYGTVDGAVCCLDSINHITSYDDLCKAFEKVALFLEDDRLFIFDVNTVYKHESVLADNTFVIEEDNIFAVWDNRYLPDEKTTQINLDFFCEESDGCYRRYSDYLEERAYTEQELKDALSSVGFSIEAVFAEQTFETVKPDTERAVYVARKGKNKWESL